MNAGDRGRLVFLFAGGGRWLVLQDAFQQQGDGAFALGGLAYFGAWGEDAQFGVGGDLFDDFGGFGFGVAVGCGFGEVEAGDLEASSKEKTCVRTSRCRSGLNAKARLGGRAFSFSYYFYFNGLRETKMPNLADLFLACKGFGLFVFPVLRFEF